MRPKKMFNKSTGSFATWMENQQQKEESANNELDNSQTSIFSSTYFQLSSIQDNLVSQFQNVTGNLPEAGPLSAAYRSRVLYSIYLVLAAAGFAVLAVVVGIPTIVIKPSKFVMCLTLSTLLAASSVIVLQKPSVFLQNILSQGIVNALPLLFLFASIVLTLYTTIFIHRYVYVLAAGGMQTLALFYYAASFVPGGTTGLQLLLRAAWLVVGTLASPFIFIVRKTVVALFKQVFS